MSYHGQIQYLKTFLTLTILTVDFEITIDQRTLTNDVQFCQTELFCHQTQ